MYFPYSKKTNAIIEHNKKVAIGIIKVLIDKFECDIASNITNGAIT